MQKITPFLWFDGKAEEAAKFHVPVFGSASHQEALPPLEGRRARLEQAYGDN
jgi:predicted 3-demethylubiquinone-9 3-methyltransferase (glyoxalase superfamily)